MTEEVIERAAIRVRGQVYSVPAPGRHHDVIYEMRIGLGLGPQDQTWEQGFVTSAGRFVDRTDACLIARAAGQIKTKTGGPNDLYSEDVW